MGRVDEFWGRFLNSTNRDKYENFSSIFHFEMTEYWANELLRLVLEGEKKATCSSLESFKIEGEELPKKGNLSIITDWDGAPRCVIETTQITILLFKDMTFDICKREGEDECLETWVDGHRKFFTEEGKEMGYEFSQDMPLVFEDFQLVYRE
jgi:uncharacterized protein YhfF